MNSIKHSILMGKLKHLLPHIVSPDNALFLSMFMIRLPPYMREAVGTGNHRKAMAMVKAAKALWTPVAAMTPLLLLPRLSIAGAPLLLRGRKVIRGAVVPS
jgi:hypothetical protein